MGKSANRHVRVSAGRSLTGPFRDARRFPSIRWCPIPRDTRTSLGFGIRPRVQGPFSVGPCRPFPDVTIRNFCIAVPERARTPAAARGCTAPPRPPQPPAARPAARTPAAALAVAWPLLRSNCWREAGPRASQFKSGWIAPRVKLKAPRSPLWVWKAATSKADPRQRQDWILKGLQSGRAHPLAARGVATLCC
jgi:hypothetical protein